MSATKPHYLLFCDGSPVSTGMSQSECRGRWRFVLEHIATGEKIEASDSESSDHLDRTSLIAVMRGLEALDQPSRVTLITTSRYVARGLQYGLTEWRENEYCWEHFGSVQPIRNADLWKRVDVALRYHEVQCRWMAQDSPASHEELQVALAGPTSSAMERACTVESSESDRACSIEGKIRDRIEDNSANQIQHIDAHPADFGATRSPIRKRRRVPRVPDQQTEASVAEQEHLRCEPVGMSLIDADTKQLDDSCSVVQRKRARIFVPVRWTWTLILAVDSFLVSCFRCMFLMDPRRDQFQPKKF